MTTSPRVAPRRPDGRRASLSVLVALALLVPAWLEAAPAGAACEAGAMFGCSDGTPGSSDEDGWSPEDGPIYHVVLTTLDGGQCWQIETGGTLTWFEAAATLADYDDPDAWRACVFDTTETIEGLWESGVCLPPPSPVSLDPRNSAATGLPGYLSVGTPVSIDLPCGPGTVTATMLRHEIDWGDGTSETTASRGSPYPDGDLTHVWQDTGSYTITVAAWWTGAVDGEPIGDLTVPTTSSLPIEVTQRQAIVTD